MSEEIKTPIQENVYTPFNIDEAYNGVPFMIENKSIIKEWYVWKEAIQYPLMVLDNQGMITFFNIDGTTNIPEKLVMIHKYIDIHMVVYRSSRGYLGGRDDIWHADVEVYHDIKEAEAIIKRMNFKDAKILSYKVLD